MLFSANSAENAAMCVPEWLGEAARREVRMG